MALARDIARSHLETLIEQLTSLEKAVPDAEGDYFIKTENAGFFARVDGEEPPIIRVYSVVAAQLEKSPELFESLNDINTNLTFLRTMWIGGQVLIEGESLAMSTDVPGFSQICRTVAMASDRFGPELLARFGGKSNFEEAKEPEYQDPDAELPGYL